VFGLFKSKKIAIHSPTSGEIIDLSQVPDEVFSLRMAGDGVAIEPTSGIFSSPIDGIVSKIFPTNHAFIIKNGDLEVIVHIGIDTVELKGEGFKVLANSGDKVKVGDSIIEADLVYISQQGKSTITPIVVNKTKIDNVKLGLVDSNTKIMEVS
jgi:glucose-specific phosphotransferase system IIA component